MLEPHMKTASRAALRAGLFALGLALPLCAPALTRPANAAALPVGALVGGADEAVIVPVYGGCGPLGHRGPYGGCRAGGQWGGYVPGRACPPGWHIGPYGRRCWRNF